LHPLAEQWQQQLEGSDLTTQDFQNMARLGSPFKIVYNNLRPFRVEVAKRIAALNTAMGWPADPPPADQAPTSVPSRRPGHRRRVARPAGRPQLRSFGSLAGVERRDELSESPRSLAPQLLELQPSPDTQVQTAHGNGYNSSGSPAATETGTASGKLGAS
jgi:hypothetical protein